MYANEQWRNPGNLRRIGVIYIPSFIGIVMSHFYASYEPISILECHKSSVLERTLLQWYRAKLPGSKTLWPYGLVREFSINWVLTQGCETAPSSSPLNYHVILVFYEQFVKRYCPLCRKRGKFCDFHENSQPSFLVGIIPCIWGFETFIFQMFHGFGVQGLLVFRH